MIRHILVYCMFVGLTGCKARAEQGGLSEDLGRAIKDPFSEGIFPNCKDDVGMDFDGPYTVILNGKEMSKSDYIELLLITSSHPAGFRIAESSRLLETYENLATERENKVKRFLNINDNRPIDPNSTLSLVLLWDAKGLSESLRNIILAKGDGGAREYRHAFLNRIQSFSNSNLILCGWK